MNRTTDPASFRPASGAAAQPERMDTAVTLALLRPAAVLLALMIALTGLAYPLALTGIASAVFPHQATGSLVERGAVVVGSALLAQDFQGPGYFHPRPSAAGFNAAGSGASNLAPSNAALIEAVRDRATAWRALNGAEAVPADAVTTSASGLDPHVSVANAMGQAARVAEARRVPSETVRALVDAQTQGPRLGLLGAARVNVLLLNLALDAAGPAAPAEP